MHKTIHRSLLLGVVCIAVVDAAPLELDDGTLKASDLATRARLARNLDELTSDEHKRREAQYPGEMRARLCTIRQPRQPTAGPLARWISGPPGHSAPDPGKAPVKVPRAG